MNKCEEFLNFGAVVKIHREQRNDLYYFIKCMLKVLYVKEYLLYFINSARICGDEIKLNINMSEDEILGILEQEYTDDYFWHLVELNIGTKVNSICLEYQVGKGFTFGNAVDYINFDNSIEILKVEDIIMSLGLADKFHLNYIETFFRNELDTDKQDLAYELDQFCDLNYWRLVKYPDGQYDILETDTNELREENATLKEIVKVAFDRLVDYNLYEDDLDGIVEEGNINYVRTTINTYITLARKYNLATEDTIKIWQEELQDYENMAEDLTED